MLGVSPDAWAKARKAMGEQAAAIVVAVMLERVDEIRSPGGYLRDLTRKAERSAFSVFPMLQALERQGE
jgi:replication initiation protein RepC